MLLFERILNFKGAPASKEQRRAARYAIGPAFPIKAVLNLMGRDELGEPLASSDGQGWDWTGKLVALSATGASMQLPPATVARRGDFCRLTLTVAGYQLKLPCRVAHAGAIKEVVLFGLQFDFTTQPVPPGYQQLLEVIALGASLKPDKTAQADADISGYITEHYRGDYGARLTAWRKETGGGVQWFEYHFAEYRIRGRLGSRDLEFATGGTSKAGQPVASTDVEEIRILLRWIIPNIPRTVPADVRDLLQTFDA